MAPTPIPLSDLPHSSSTTAASATLYISAQVRIRAPAKNVYAILTDLARYGEWNSFVQGADVTAPASGFASPMPSVGDKVTLHVLMKSEPLTDAKVVVREVSHPLSHSGQDQAKEREGEEKPHRLAWAGDGFPAFLLSAYRVMEVRPAAADGSGGGGCEFRTWETMSGPLAHVVKGLYGGVLQARFEEMAADLRVRAEEGERKMVADVAGRV